MASSRQKIFLALPLGRIVFGNPHKAQPVTEDDNRTPKKIKSGPNAGQDLYMFNVGVAIPKTPGVDWKQEPWGQQIVAEALACWPGGQTQQRDFSYKVQDGDSTDMNSNMKRNCDKTGYPGNWIVVTSGIGAPRIYDGTLPGTAKEVYEDHEFILPGDLAILYVGVKSNDSAKTAGMYVDPVAVCFKGHHKDGRIQLQVSVPVDVFGSGAAPGSVPLPGAPAPAPAPVSAPPVAAAPPAPTAVTPSATFVPVAPPVAPPPAPVVKLTAEQDGWAPHPDNAAFMWKGSEVLPVADVRARYA